MIRELRYTMKVLSESPIEVNTGQYKPKKQDRQYSDMEDESANRLKEQPDFQAKVKVQSGEYDVRT
jgi:hypothetical protein